MQKDIDEGLQIELDFIQEKLEQASEAIKNKSWEELLCAYDDLMTGNQFEALVEELAERLEMLQEEEEKYKHRYEQ